MRNANVSIHETPGGQPSYTYDNAPLGYGGVLSAKRPPGFSPVSNSVNNPNYDAYTSFKVTPHKLKQNPFSNNHRYSEDVQTSKDFEYQYQIKDSRPGAQKPHH